MAANLAVAQEKWARNAVAGAKNWHGDESAYCQGLAKFGLGVAQCQAGVGARYAQGIAAVGPAAFAQSIQQAVTSDKWSRRFLEGISR